MLRRVSGSPVPLGYVLIEVEKRGTKIKKTLAIDPVDAETVQLIYKLYLNGDGTSGVLGVKEVVKWLNSRGSRTRKGRTFGVGTIYKILTSTTYMDEWKFNRMSSRTGKWKADEEVVTSAVLAIIEPHLFEQVQRQLHARSPKVAAPRVTTGPILCASCNGGMTLRTGTSKTGAVHRYYTCSTCARKGKTVCKGRSIPMAKLDNLVTTHMNERLFQPERLAVILSSLSSQRSEKADSVNARVTTLQREVADADDKLKRLYRLVEDGMTEMDDVLKDRLNSLKADRDRAKAALERAKSHSSQAIQIDPALLEQFGRTMRENFSSGSILFRKAYLQSLIDVIEIDDTQIRIKGSKDVLERAVLASRNGTIPGSQTSTGWRSLGESNSCFRRERAKTGALWIFTDTCQ
jgi:site-specific DNA recombinase